MFRALIGLGSNLGNRAQNLDRAVRLLTQTPGVHTVHESSWRSTRAVGGPPNQADYLNGAVHLETSLPPQHLLARLAEIEAQLGRARHARWSPRMIDLDLLLVDQQVLRVSGLELPHPRMSFRRFVLEAAAEVAPDMLHPLCGMTVSELLKHLNASPPYVAIRGENRPQNLQLANAVAERVGWKVIDLPASLAVLNSVSSTGLEKDRAIEFPDDFLPLVERGRWPGGLAGVLTPYWLGDLSLQGVSMTQPRLLVCFAEAAAGVSESTAGQPFNYVGPILRLDAADPQNAETELVAAIQAMS